MANYSNYAISAYFNPMSFDDMMKPMSRLTELSDKMDEQYVDLRTKSGDFKYLSETMPEGSDARKIYEKYANDLEAQANNLMQNGVNFDTRNSLLDLRGRYSGEIGMLDKAQKQLEKERELRRQEYGKDNTLLYAQDDLNIDNYINGRTPNQYRVSGNDLYARGAAAAKAISARTTSTEEGGNVLGGYYRDWVTRIGMGQATMDDFRRDAGTQPALLAAADGILKERGIDKQLTGDKYQQARQYVINGIIDGVGYSEEHKPMRNPGALDPIQQLQKQKAQMELNEANFALGNITRSYRTADGSTVSYRYDPLRQGYSGTVTDADGSKHNFTGTPTADGIRWDGLDGEGLTSKTTIASKSKKKKDTSKPEQKTVTEQGYSPIDGGSSIGSSRTPVEDIPSNLKMSDFSDAKERQKFATAIRRTGINPGDWDKKTNQEKATAIAAAGLKRVKDGSGWQYVSSNTTTKTKTNSSNRSK